MRKADDRWVVLKDDSNSFRVGVSEFDIYNIRGTVELGHFLPGTIFKNFKTNEVLTVMWSREDGWSLKREKCDE